MFHLVFKSRSHRRLLVDVVLASRQRACRFAQASDGDIHAPDDSRSYFERGLVDRLSRPTEANHLITLRLALLLRARIPRFLHWWELGRKVNPSFSLREGTLGIGRAEGIACRCAACSQ